MSMDNVRDVKAFFAGNRDSVVHGFVDAMIARRGDIHAALVKWHSSSVYVKAPQSRRDVADARVTDFIRAVRK